MDAFFHIAVLLCSHNTDYMNSLHDQVPSKWTHFLHIAVLLCSHNTDYMDSLHDQLPSKWTHFLHIAVLLCSHNTDYMNSLHDQVPSKWTHFLHIAVPLCSHNTDYMDTLHEPVNNLARIWWWPPWGLILVWSETCRGERILCDFNEFFNKHVHELVTIDTSNSKSFVRFQ